jgi:hypothetical protein
MSFYYSILANWHAPCKASHVGDRMVRNANTQGDTIMTTRFEAVQRVAFSLIAALVLTTVLASTAVSFVPVA